MIDYLQVSNCLNTVQLLLKTVGGDAQMAPAPHMVKTLKEVQISEV